MHTESLHLREIVIFLTAAGLVVPVMHRLRVSPVLGFLLVGLAIGPYGLGRLTDTFPWLSVIVIQDLESVRAIAELGIVFLLFIIGLELSLDRLIALRRLVFGLGAAQVVITTLVIGGIAWAYGNSTAAAITIGACLALSSTAIVMQLLIESQRLGTPVGQTSFSVLLFQDLAVVPILFLVATLGAQDRNGFLLPLLLAVAVAALVVFAIIALGRVIVRPLFHLVSATNSRESFMAAMLLLIIGTAVLTNAAGLSLALGAFLAGLLLAETEFRHQIEVDVEPFKGLLLGLFFVSVGMSLDLAHILQEPWQITYAVAGLILIKAGILFILCKLFALPSPVALETALLLGTGGEFAFVIMSQAMTHKLIADDIVQFMLIVTLISMFLTPFIARGARALAAQLQSRPAADTIAPPADALGALSGHVIISGYGRVGQLLGSLLNEQGIAYVALDRDAALVAHYRKTDTAVYFGDASREDVLRRLGIERANAIVVTMDSSKATERVVATVHQRWPELPILARARDSQHATRLLSLGASSVVPETVEASLDLAEVVFTQAGVDFETAHRLVAERRDQERLNLSRSIDKTDPENTNQHAQAPDG